MLLLVLILCPLYVILTSQQLQKTKKDKDKAIRIIVELVGKDKISSFLNQHAGSADILDKLLDFVAANHVIKAVGSSTSSGGGVFNGSGGGGTRIGLQQSQTVMSPIRSSGGKARATSPKKPAHYRSRIDEYFRTAMSGRDY